MTKPAAIQASYADYRRVKGRKVLQLIFEVPLEMAPTVHEAFGEPLPDGSTWVAVARIDKSVADKPRGGKLAQRAGILCSEKAFQKFLEEEYSVWFVNDICADEDEAARAIRDICGIQSRAELDHHKEAAKTFIVIEAKYRAWLTQ